MLVLILLVWQVCANDMSCAIFPSNYQLEFLYVDFDYWILVGFKIDLEKYPTKEQQLKWIRWFLEYKAEFKGESPDSITQKDVEEMQYNAQIFAMVWLEPEFSM